MTDKAPAKEPSGTEKMFGDLALGLVHFTDDVLFSGVEAPAAVTEGALTMRGAILHAPRDVRVEQREDPRIEQPTDVVIRLAATCVCGSDLWPYRGIEPPAGSCDV